jgi:hypothetical protein
VTYQNEKVFQKWEYLYDKIGNMTGTTINDPEGKLIGKFNYKFDKKGNQIEYSGTGESETKEKYKYDKEGNMMELDIFGKDNSISEKTTFTYDKNRFKTGTVKSTKYTKENLSYKNDSNGNIIEENHFNEESKPTIFIKYEYEYFK